MSLSHRFQENLWILFEHNIYKINATTDIQPTRHAATNGFKFCNNKKKKQEVKKTDNSRPLRPHIQGHSRSLTYPIENLYTRLIISD